jgi:hypothetical protein
VGLLDAIDGVNLHPSCLGGELRARGLASCGLA